jgi:hypothetical protein
VEVNISHQIKNREISTKSIFSRLPVAEFRESNHQIAIFGAQKRALPPQLQATFAKVSMS